MDRKTSVLRAACKTMASRWTEVGSSTFLHWGDTNLGLFSTYLLI